MVAADKVWISLSLDFIPHHLHWDCHRRGSLISTVTALQKQHKLNRFYSKTESLKWSVPLFGSFSTQITVIPVHKNTPPCFPTKLLWQQSFNLKRWGMFADGNPPENPMKECMFDVWFLFPQWVKDMFFSHEPREQAPVTLLHNGDFLDDLLKIRLHRNLFDGYNLPGLFIMGFKHTAIRPADTQRQRFNMWC